MILNGVKASERDEAWPVCDDSADDDEQDFHLSAASVRRSSLAMEVVGRGDRV